MTIQRIQDQCLVPTWQLRNICNSRSRGFEALFWPQWALGIHVVYRRSTHTHKIIKKCKNIMCFVLSLEPPGRLGRRIRDNDFTRPGLGWADGPLGKDTARPGTWVQSLELTWGKERTVSHVLSSDLCVCAICTCTSLYTHTVNECNKSQIIKGEARLICLACLGPAFGSSITKVRASLMGVWQEIQAFIFLLSQYSTALSPLNR